METKLSSSPAAAGAPTSTPPTGPAKVSPTDFYSQMAVRTMQQDLAAATSQKLPPAKKEPVRTLAPSPPPIPDKLPVAGLEIPKPPVPPQAIKPPVPPQAIKPPAAPQATDKEKIARKQRQAELKLLFAAAKNKIGSANWTEAAGDLQKIISDPAVGWFLKWRAQRQVKHIQTARQKAERAVILNQQKAAKQVQDQLAQIQKKQAEQAKLAEAERIKIIKQQEEDKRQVELKQQEEQKRLEELKRAETKRQEDLKKQAEAKPPIIPVPVIKPWAATAAAPPSNLPAAPEPMTPARPEIPAVKIAPPAQVAPPQPKPIIPPSIIKPPAPPMAVPTVPFAPPTKPLPPRIVPPAAYQPPAAAQPFNVFKILLIAIPSILAIALISAGWLYFANQPTPTATPSLSVSTTPSLTPSPSQTVSPIPGALFPMDTKRRLALGQSLTTLAQTTEPAGTFTYLIFENNQGTALTFEQIKSALKMDIFDLPIQNCQSAENCLGTGTTLKNQLNDNQFSFFVYAQEEPNASPFTGGQTQGRVGFIVSTKEITASTTPFGAPVESSWLIQNLRDIEPLLVSGFSQLLFKDAQTLPANPSFADNAYRGVSIRFFNLTADAKLSIDYAIINNKLLITTSKESMLAAIDRLLNNE